VTGQAIWQPEVVEKLRSELGDEDGVLVREIIQVYLVQAWDLLAQLEVAARRADEDQLRALAHWLKGSTATIGGGRLAAECDRLEHAGSAELAASEAWQGVRREFDLLATELERHYPLLAGLFGSGKTP
jgi:HPt (histidine-containing phosphotransfer) domain-containing protein